MQPCLKSIRVVFYFAFCFVLVWFFFSPHFSYLFPYLPVQYFSYIGLFFIPTCVPVFQILYFVFCCTLLPCASFLLLHEKVGYWKGSRTSSKFQLYGMSVLHNAFYSLCNFFEIPWRAFCWKREKIM